MKRMPRVFAGVLGLILALCMTPAAQAQAFGRLEGLETNASVYAFARPGDATKRVYVWGAVQRPGVYEVVTTTDLSALLSLAGGPLLPVTNDETEQRITLRLYRTEGEVRRAVFTAPVDSLLQRPLPMPAEGDVVEITVSQRRIRTWRDNLTYVSAGASLVSVLVSIVSLLR
jgi:hypothetical protein